MKKPRHVSPDEQALWDTVAKRTEPLEKAPKTFVRTAPRQPNLAPNMIRPLQSFKVGQKVNHSADHDLIPSLGQQMRDAVVQMDRKAYGKMKRGKLKPDARLDLHGMTLAQAHPALISFMMRSASAGNRLVLIITGKGKDRDDGGPIPTKFGVLRHQVPQWLRMAPIASLVLQVTESHVRHGGQGAYYVYLRRPR